MVCIHNCVGNVYNFTICTNQVSQKLAKTALFFTVLITFSTACTVSTVRSAAGAEASWMACCISDNMPIVRFHHRQSLLVAAAAEAVIHIADIYY